MSRSRTLLSTGFALSLALSAPDASAQSAEGTLVDGESRRPIASTFVLLLARDGREVDRTLTDSAGHFAVMAPEPGMYRLRAERMGYVFDPSAEMPIGPDGSGDVSYTPRSARVDLSALAAMPPVCEVQDQSLLSAAWDEVTKALRASIWTGARSGLSYRVRVFERTVGPDRATVRHQHDSLVQATMEMPFASDNRASELGFVRPAADSGWIYHAAGPQDLLDDGFTETHCFGVRRDREPGMVGITFGHASGAPVGPSDVAGIAWLDSSTGLSEIEYHYPGDPSRSGSAESAGGHLTFHHLGSGLTLLSSWKLVMPTLTARDTAGQRTLSGFEEIGATLLSAAQGDEPVYVHDAVTSVRGTVFDSTRGAPLSDGVVALAGTDVWTVTGDDGSYFLAGYLEGVYRLVYGNGRLDSLGFLSRGHALTLSHGAAIVHDLTVPSLTSILADRCADWEPDPRRRVVVGVVRAEADGTPVPGAVINVRRDNLPGEFERFISQRFDNDGVTDSLGTFALCGVPVGETIVVNAVTRDRASAFVPVRFGSNDVSFGENMIAPLEAPVARLDLELVERDRWSASVGGIVTAANSRQVIAGATVTVDGTGFSTPTDSMGRFNLTGLPAGHVQLLIRKLGFRPLRRELVITSDAVMTLSAGTLTMEPGPDDITVLDPISVEAEAAAPVTSGFEERRAMGIGSFATRAQIERWNPAVTTDILRHMRGIRVTPNAYYGVGGDTRRFIIASSRDPGMRITQLITTPIEREPGTMSGTPGVLQVAECPVLLFMDGVYVGDSRTTDIDNIMSTTNLVAVEVYSASQLPSRFALPGATCGAVVMWTQ
jgi:Carboxypeptidase regulatory-like domain